MVDILPMVGLGILIGTCFRTYQKVSGKYVWATLGISFLIGIPLSIVGGFILKLEPERMGELFWFWAGMSSVIVSWYLIKKKGKKGK